jgi:molecular chaperone DnaK (HSP70)
VARPRYVVGIDLGTTNSALSSVDTSNGPTEPTPAPLAIPQILQPGVIEDRLLLPSFLYLPGAGEQPAGSLALPWAADRDFAVGEFARHFGSQVPTRLVSSAKSWLCQPGVDRRQAILPWRAPDTVRHVSPLEASTRYLRHLSEAWNYRVGGDVPEKWLEQQEIILTVPASFDAAARELTVEAAQAAGLENLTLLEEPQAAFYAWLDANRETWRKQVEVGDVVLVCDLGGGTTDLSLIAVGEDAGQLSLTRIAAGDHILLGGDNMDLALAHDVAKALAEKGTKLDAGQMQMLWHGCRAAKERLADDPKLSGTPVTVLGRGSRVIGGSIKSELTRSAMNRVLLDGFFPECAADAEPVRQRSVGLQELGLSYAMDPAITKHIAHFLRTHSEVLAERASTRRGKKKVAQPTAILFNGGVFKAEPIRRKLLDVLNQWIHKAGGAALKILEGNDLDLAVARGAAYYGMVRRGQGVRIRGGASRSYYIGIETSQPAIPGMAPPLKALCVAPLGMEEGTESDVPGQEFGIVVGQPAQFRFLGSTTRRGDSVGAMIDDWEGQIEELSPLTTTLSGAGSEGKTVPVHIHCKFTEIGVLEVWCQSRDGKQRWKLEFNVREREG